MSRSAGSPVASIPKCRCMKLPVRGVAMLSCRNAGFTAPVTGSGGASEQCQLERGTAWQLLHEPAMSASLKRTPAAAAKT
jgi:hypothetical protein